MFANITAGIKPLVPIPENRCAGLGSVCTTRRNRLFGQYRERVVELSFIPVKQYAGDYLEALGFLRRHGFDLTGIFPNKPHQEPGGDRGRCRVSSEVALLRVVARRHRSTH